MRICNLANVLTLMVSIYLHIVLIIPKYARSVAKSTAQNKTDYQCIYCIKLKYHKTDFYINLSAFDALFAVCQQKLKKH